jgi:hypothetical protein
LNDAVDCGGGRYCQAGLICTADNKCKTQASIDADNRRKVEEELKKQQADLAQQAASTAKKKADDEARAKAEADRQRLAMLQLQEAEAVKGFDGRWKHVWRALNSFCRLQNNTTYLTIKNGKVFGDRIVSGSVRPDGVIVYTRRSAVDNSSIGHFSGKLIGNQGSAQERNGQCIGGITLTRMGG